MTFTALPTETWGRRFRRARQDVARLTQRDVAAKISANYYDVSYSLIDRLEKRDRPPVSRAHRIIAAVALVTYGVDPISEQIDLDDLPQWVRDLRDQQSPCMTRRPALARTG